MNPEVICVLSLVQMFLSISSKLPLTNYHRAGVSWRELKSCCEYTKSLPVMKSHTCYRPCCIAFWTNDATAVNAVDGE